MSDIGPETGEVRYIPLCPQPLHDDTGQGGPDLPPDTDRSEYVMALSLKDKNGKILVIYAGCGSHLIAIHKSLLEENK